MLHGDRPFARHQHPASDHHPFGRRYYDLALLRWHWETLRAWVLDGRETALRLHDHQRYPSAPR